jgi:hypothetical protein
MKSTDQRGCRGDLIPYNHEIFKFEHIEGCLFCGKKPGFLREKVSSRPGISIMFSHECDVVTMNKNCSLHDGKKLIREWNLKVTAGKNRIIKEVEAEGVM